MTTPDYQYLILEGLKGLPPEVLAEINDFVYFVRKRVLQPDVFADELVALQRLSRAETAHLEAEFENYERRYPLE